MIVDGINTDLFKCIEMNKNIKKILKNILILRFTFMQVV